MKTANPCGCTHTHTHNIFTKQVYNVARKPKF